MDVIPREKVRQLTGFGMAIGIVSSAMDDRALKPLGIPLIGGLDGSSIVGRYLLPYFAYSANFPRSEDKEIFDDLFNQ